MWGPTRQVLALALYFGETVRRSRGMAGEWDQDTEMHRVRKIMVMVDYGGAAVARAEGHTLQVVSPQASATGAADQGVTDLVQDGHTWWVVEPRGEKKKVPTRTGPCCTPSTITRHSQGLAPHQGLHFHKKKKKTPSHKPLQYPSTIQIQSTLQASVQHTGCLTVGGMYNNCTKEESPAIGI